ncbi:MAG: glycosyltransferase [Bacteroidetes bacterium]|nr:MAG: glycosyltransferase [Bacteroidota bacterium]
MELLLITNSFPYGKTESFLEGEVPYLAAQFGRVYVLPMQREGEVARPLPANCELVPMPEAFRSQHKLQLRNLPFVLPALWAAFRAEGTHALARRIFFQNIKDILKDLNQAACWYKGLRWLRQQGRLPLQPAVVYSYWLDKWLVSFLFFKRRYFPSARIISRVHGYDLYFERGFNNYLPFRPFFLKNLDRIFPISFTGFQYLKGKFPWASNLETAFLGVEAPAGLGPVEEVPPLRLVSCASMLPLKRIHLLIEALAHIGVPVRWTHFGDGPLREELTARAQALPAQVQWEFRGHVSNQALLDFYARQPVDLFVNTSETEGIPVSIMEAISFGIPVAATDVGGTAEIVNDALGYLLPAALQPRQLQAVLEAYAGLSPDQRLQKRRAARQQFEQKFQAGKNYAHFCRRILEI